MSNNLQILKYWFQCIRIYGSYLFMIHQMEVLKNIFYFYIASKIKSTKLDENQFNISEKLEKQNCVL